MSEFKVGDEVRLLENVLTWSGHIKIGEEGHVIFIEPLLMVAISGREIYVMPSQITTVNLHQRTSESAAVVTLTDLGYTWCGGEQWKPPIGKPWVDLTKLDTPFGELDRATQLRLVEHVLDGGDIERFEIEGWSTRSTGTNGLLCFVPVHSYRTVHHVTELETLELERDELDKRIAALCKGDV